MPLPHLQQPHPEKGLTYLTQTQRPGDCVAEKKEEQKVSPSPLVTVPSATPTTPQSICACGGAAGVGACLQAKQEIYLLYRVNQLPEGQGSGVK